MRRFVQPGTAAVAGGDLAEASGYRRGAARPAIDPLTRSKAGLSWSMM
jgi:hypothetical protein